MTTIRRLSLTMPYSLATTTGEPPQEAMHLRTLEPTMASQRGPSGAIPAPLNQIIVNPASMCAQPVAAWQRYVRGIVGQSRTPTALDCAQGILAHACMQAAFSAPVLAVLWDKTKPIGPTFLNPLGQADDDGPIIALCCAALGNIICAPMAAAFVHRRWSKARWPGETDMYRRSEAFGVGVAAVFGAIVATALLLKGLHAEMTRRGAAYGWQNGAFPDAYYWRATFWASTALAPVAAHSAFHAACDLELSFYQSQ